MSKKTGGPAFPVALQSGMTLRDWFAGKAMQALCRYEEWSEGEIAEHAYLMADAMIAERENPNDP